MTGSAPRPPRPPPRRAGSCRRPSRPGRRAAAPARNSGWVSERARRCPCTVRGGQREALARRRAMACAAHEGAEADLRALQVLEDRDRAAPAAPPPRGCARITSACSAWVPCEKFRRATSMPAATSRSSIGARSTRPGRWCRRSWCDASATPRRHARLTATVSAGRQELAGVGLVGLAGHVLRACRWRSRGRPRRRPRGRGR